MSAARPDHEDTRPFKTSGGENLLFPSSLDVKSVCRKIKLSPKSTETKHTWTKPQISAVIEVPFFTIYT